MPALHADMDQLHGFSDSRVYIQRDAKFSGKRHARIKCHDAGEVRFARCHQESSGVEVVGDFPLTLTLQVR